MKFRKKPIVIEAIQWTFVSAEPQNNNFADVKDFAGNHCYLDTFKGLSIFTPEGVMTASNGDWIIKGVKGEFYPCKPDVFEQALANGYADSRDDAARAHMNKAHKQIDAHDGAIYIDPIFGAFCYGADWSHASLAPLHRALVEAVSAAKQTLWINECRCNEAYTGRGVHEPNALCGEMDELVQALASLENAIKQTETK